MDLPADALVSPLCLAAGLGRLEAVSPLPGGSNNRVFKVAAAGGDALLKAYHRSPDDPRDRLAVEYGFCRYAWDAGVRAAPRPLASDPRNGLALYEFVEGRRLGPAEATAERVDEAADFFAALNLRRRDAASMPDASEARFSIAEHVELIARRVERLASIPAGSPAGSAAAAFARGELARAWERARKAALAEPGAEETLAAEDRRLSPSDFGFHNALLEPNGKLRFIDFEYAGWDDPAKLVCDFYCQPAVPAPASTFEAFARRAAAGLRSRDACLRRIDVLLPAYRLKWCCILLNDFAPDGARRRRFAGAETNEKALAAQLEKARAALAEANA
jgi:predicted Ser/Thr protein kinase